MNRRLALAALVVALCVIAAECGVLTALTVYALTWGVR